MPGRLRDPSPSARRGRLGDAIDPPAHGAPAKNERADAALDEPTGPYEGWRLVELRKRAAALGIVGRSGMRKDDLIRALRSRSDPSAKSGQSGPWGSAS